LNLTFGLEAGLQQKQMQTAQMIQMMNIIQQNALQLEQYIRQEAEINPLLEISDEQNFERESETQGIRDEDGEFCTDRSKMDSSAALEDGFEHSDELRSDESFSEFDSEKRNYAESLRVYSQTLEDKLKEQITDMSLEKSVQKIAFYLIGELDENGFLSIDYDEIKENFGVDFQTVEQAVEAIQNCEPSGVGAENLKESLLLQLDKLGYDDSDLIYKIIQKCWDLFIHGKITTIARKFEIEPIEVQEALEIVKQLNLSPAKEEEKDTAEVIIPDLIVRFEEGEWKVSVNDEFMPNLEINQQYSDMLKRQFKADRDTKEFIRDKYNKANWLINAVEQRRMTMIITMYAIIKRQPNFFTMAASTGSATESATKERSLLPLNLADIAADTGLHQSTLSRVSNNKYVITPFGMFELKYFFSEVIMQNEDGDISTRKIKDKLRELIENEDKSEPLSDQQLADELEKAELPIARRTVAKYREQLGFATARLRKKY